MRQAVERVAAHQFDRNGQRTWQQIQGALDDEHTRLRIGQVSVPFGICMEPSNIKAGGQACPFRFRRLGCGHFRTDASYLPELKDYLQTLLRDRERVLATGELDPWARTEAVPSETEITKLRQLIHRCTPPNCNNNSPTAKTTSTPPTLRTASSSPASRRA
ncbi:MULTISPECIES: hypothetical protein [unclassified Streptomyces]|uniref:hypothetical protein n=1 Tax=unclassified Streptomyces TaxID=2593676 RepID=UPI0022537B94|nr:hypothetical protein [Streptomyces sp. NBC_00047]MCX5613479.1 hypothetical protein [Streptomyces sp. NBC_00047]